MLCSAQRTALSPYLDTCSESAASERTALCSHSEFRRDLSRQCSTSTVHTRVKAFYLLLTSIISPVSLMEVGSSTVDRLCQTLPTTFDGKPTGPNYNATETRRSLSRSEVALHEDSVALGSRLKHHGDQHSLDEFLASEKVVAPSHVGAGQRRETRKESRYTRTILACLWVDHVYTHFSKLIGGYRSSGLGKLVPPQTHPAAIIIGQSILLTAAWSFFFTLLRLESIPLPFYLAVAIRNNPTMLTLVVTLISTAISALSSLWVRHSCSTTWKGPDIFIAAFSRSQFDMLWIITYFTAHWKSIHWAQPSEFSINPFFLIRCTYGGPLYPWQ